MIPAFMGDVGIFSVYLFEAYFTAVGHIEMLAMGTFYVVLGSMELAATLATNQAGVTSSNVASDKILQLLISLYKRNKTSEDIPKTYYISNAFKTETCSFVAFYMTGYGLLEMF